MVDLHRVQALCEGRLVADHERVWCKHQTITDPAHAAAGHQLRRARTGALRPVTDSDVEQRNLSVYDSLLGDEGGVA